VAKKSNIVGPKVRELRKARGWTQDQLAARMQIAGSEMTREVLANIETQRSGVDDMEIQQFAHVLRVDYRDLFPPWPKPLGNPSR
jgi:transcriptional regulator with XRE-family HTH domain